MSLITYLWSCWALFSLEVKWRMIFRSWLKSIRKNAWMIIFAFSSYLLSLATFVTLWNIILTVSFMNIWFVLLNLLATHVFHVTVFESVISPECLSTPSFIPSGRLNLAVLVNPALLSVPARQSPTLLSRPAQRTNTTAVETNTVCIADEMQLMPRWCYVCWWYTTLNQMSSARNESLIQCLCAHAQGDNQWLCSNQSISGGREGGGGGGLLLLLTLTSAMDQPCQGCKADHKLASSIWDGNSGRVRHVLNALKNNTIKLHSTLALLIKTQRHGVISHKCKEMA